MNSMIDEQIDYTIMYTKHHRTFCRYQ